MTVDANSIDLAAVMAEHLETAEPDLLRELLRTFVQALMSADADAACCAAYGTHSAERTNTRNGFGPGAWTRPLDAGPYTFVAADALTMKVCEARRRSTCTP